MEPMIDENVSNAYFDGEFKSENNYDFFACRSPIEKEPLWCFSFFVAFQYK